MTTPNNKNKELLLEKKRIANSFIEKAFNCYPEWQGKQQLPAPIYPKALNNVDLSTKRMQQLSLEPITLSVLCGTSCSDSSLKINKGYANARFQLKHSTRQFTWFTWKCFVVLKDFTSQEGVCFSYPDGYQKQTTSLPGEILGKLKIASKADPKLTQLHEIISVENKVKLQRFWLNHMNNYFLMTIWLDDGSLYNGRQGVICFNSFSEKEKQIFREYLLNVWSIKTHLQDTGKIMKNGQANKRIAISDQDSLLKLLRLVAPVIPIREMLYKVCFVPDGNPSLLQRWKTELKALVRTEFKEYIEEYYSEINDKLQE